MSLILNDTIHHPSQGYYLLLMIALQKWQLENYYTEIQQKRNQYDTLNTEEQVSERKERPLLRYLVNQ